MENTSNKLSPKKKRDVAYYRQRQKNRVFTQVISFLAEEMEKKGLTKKDLAVALSKDPSQITRLFSAPSNVELDTLSDILLAFDAEMDHRIVRFKDRPNPNYAHPAIASFIGKFSDTKPQRVTLPTSEAASNVMRVKTVPGITQVQARVKVTTP